ncbi:hypothetical protein QQZ08_002085 [Neonectria magnoliae]|uniref:NADP-dependent oxidoreductase domain-containing protein n=1 Tax=Neonectria magnoliae TaxID=2732573 RepID=A0ABR1IE77_9HYPO
MGTSTWLRHHHIIKLMHHAQRCTLHTISKELAARFDCVCTEKSHTITFDTNIKNISNRKQIWPKHSPLPIFKSLRLALARWASALAWVSNLSLEQAEPVLLKAIELGCTFWDTAVVYQAGVNEKLLGDFIRKHNVRDKIFIASKCGFDVFGNGEVTNPAAHIKKYIDGTIERLGFAPDLYYIHRIDPNAPLEESIPALDEIRKAGKTKYIGLSECSAKTLRKANSSKIHIDTVTRSRIHRLQMIVAKIDAVQAEYSAFETLHEADGLIDTAKELGIVDEIKKLADRKGCTLTQIALAWVATQGMIAIPGTTKPHRLEENFASREIQFTEEESKAMREIIDAAKPLGNRYSEKGQSMVGH